MADFITVKQRSRLMAKVRNRNTKPEQQIRSGLHQAGFRFRLHIKTLSGTPDIVLKKYNAIIFIHGCFWHGHEGCKKAILPQTRKEFWEKKINGNIARDRKYCELLIEHGWRIAVVWECATKNISKLSATLNTMIEWLPAKTPFLEIPSSPFPIKMV